MTHPNHEVLFVSDPIPGRIVGTPVITSNFRHRGQFIFVVHNTNTASTVLTPIGHFSILQTSQNGTLVWTESAADSNNTADHLPYAPMGVEPSPSRTKFGIPEFNDNDLVVWGTSAQNGFSNQGVTRAFQFPLFFDITLISVLSTTRLRDVRWSTITKPTFSPDGQSMYFGASEARARGWTGITLFDGTATWGVQLRRDPNIRPTPIQQAPALSKGESRVFFTEPAGSLACLDAIDGTLIWRRNGNNLFTNEPKPSSDDRVVYSMQVGRVVSLALGEQF